MHEHSLVRTLLKQVEAIRCQHAADAVTEVRVEVGPLSGVEPMRLSTVFEQLSPGSMVTDAKLVIDEVPLLAVCKSCNCELEVKDFVFQCPLCGDNVRVIRGDEFQLVSVSLKTYASTQEPV